MVRYEYDWLSSTNRIHSALQRSIPPVFQGPLALLLHLIEKNELDITKIALAQVTDAFLTYVDAMRDTMDITVVAEFLSVAARLIWIKSRALLPKPPASAKEQLNEQDVGDEFVPAAPLLTGNINNLQPGCWSEIATNCVHVAV